MPNLKGLALLGSVVFFTACASGNVLRVTGIKSTDESGISQCKYLDTVYGTSGWYGVFAEKGFENARASAFEKAKTLGATDVVWVVIPQHYGSTDVAAKAYHCEGVPKIDAKL